MRARKVMGSIWKCRKCFCQFASVEQRIGGQLADMRVTCGGCGRIEYTYIYLGSPYTKRKYTNPPVFNRIPASDIQRLLGVATSPRDEYASLVDKTQSKYHVYLLFRQSALIYIGRSRNARERLASHATCGLQGPERCRLPGHKFSEVAVCEMPSEPVMESVERILIWLFRPFDNSSVRRPKASDCEMAAEWFMHHGFSLQPLRDSLNTHMEEAA